MDKLILKEQLTKGCGNSLCENQHCKSSKQFDEKYATIQDLDKTVNDITNKFGRMSICVPSILQILNRWNNYEKFTFDAAWSTQVNSIELSDLDNLTHFQIQQQTNFPFLQEILSCNLNSLDQLEYFLNSHQDIYKAVLLNQFFFDTLLQLEQEDPLLQKEDQIIEMNGKLTQFIQKLLDVLFNNTYVLAQDLSQKPSNRLLYLLLLLPEQFTERSSIATVCTATLFCSLQTSEEKQEFYQYFKKLLISYSSCFQVYDTIEQIICCCNQYISVLLSLNDKPRKAVSILDLQNQKRELFSVIQLMQFIQNLLNDQEIIDLFTSNNSVENNHDDKRIKLLNELQNEYINSSTYNITPDTDFWLQQNPSELNIECLPLPIQMMVRSHIRPRQYPEDMISILQYPFLLNCGTKQQIFKYECTRNIPHLGKLTVRRDSIVNDTLDYIVKLSPDWKSEQNKALLRIPLKIQFDGEEGIDAGGLSNEFFSLVCDQLFSDKYNLFQYYEQSRVYYFNKFPMLEENDLQTYYTFVGIIFGLAMLNGVNIENHFPQFFYKKLLNQEVVFEDIQELDEQLYQSLLFIKNYANDDLEDVLCQNFTVVENVFGDFLKVNLLENGENIFVTQQNKDQYIQLKFEYETDLSIQQQFLYFKKGFNLITQCSSLKLFNKKDLELALCGEPRLDFEQLKKNAKYQQPYSEKHKIVIWFWQVLLEEFNDAQKINFMKFTFGSARAPAGGLSRQRFEIHKNGVDDDRLPTSHTCFGILMIPEYSNKQILKEKLEKSIFNNEGFGLQ